MTTVSARNRSMVAGLALAGALFVPGAALAHMGSTKYVDARVVESGVELVVHVQAVDVGVALGLGMHPSDAALAQHERVLQGWVARGLGVESDAGACTPEVGEPRSVVRDGKPFVAVPIAHACPAAATSYTLSDDTVFAEDPDHRTFVTVTTRESEASYVLRAGEQSLALAAASSPVATALAYLREGAIHLVTGFDHLLFVLSLVLVASLGLRRDGLRPTLRDVAWIVTAFTIGHSLSLCAAALGFVALPSAWVEAGIAASIVLVAAVNVVRPRAPDASSRRRRAVIAGAFGLLHGFGFSSVLAEVGLSAQHRLLALMGFNLGIELAQLAFVLAVLAMLMLLSRHAAYRRVVVQGGSLAIAVMGCVWTIERTLGP
jgi:hypothetical protein